MLAGEPMVDADFRPAQAGEERFGLVGARAIVADELDTVIDALAVFGRRWDPVK
jgi:hypothetical protein